MPRFVRAPHPGAVPEDKVAEVTGIGDLDVPAGKTTFPITVTAENGDIRIYNIEVEREKSANPYPINIKIDGLIPKLLVIILSIPATINIKIIYPINIKVTFFILFILYLWNI